MIESMRTNAFPLVLARGDESPGRTLPDLMIDLVKRLTNRSGRKAADTQRGLVHQYQDKDFDYVEVALTGLDDVVADICIHGGRVFVRIAR
jgi:hypothetical protein